MHRKLFVAFAFSLSLTIIHGQDANPWKNKKCAVSLTYDDALLVHLTNVIPVLDSLKLKGTFYLSCYFPGFSQHINEWKKAGQKGHELANHTLFHPCIGSRPGREWVNPENDMSKYTVKRMTDEMRMTNILLETLDGKKKRTFAYPCGDTKIGDSFYLDKKDFIAARTVIPSYTPITQSHMYTIG